jgi:hypothetical protein
VLRTHKILRAYGASLILLGNPFHLDLFIERNILCLGTGMVNILKDFYVVPKRRQTITTRRRVMSQKNTDLINMAAEA